MKKYIQLLVIVVVFSFAAGLSGCGSDPEPTEAERVTELLTSGSWKIQSVSIDAVDKTSMFTGLQLVFTPSSFAATNGGLIWPATGSWQFTTDEATTIKRNDDIEVGIGEVSETKLVLLLSWSSSTFGPGRVSSIGGQHIFTFSK